MDTSDLDLFYKMFIKRMSDVNISMSAVSRILCASESNAWQTNTKLFGSLTLSVLFRAI